MTQTRQPLIAILALGAALAMPAAFAQDATTEAAPPADATEQAAPAEAAPQASGQITWADVDADKDGAISREESAKLASLAQVFDDADADSDGLLTPDEYKAYVARTDGGADDDAG